MVKMTEKKIIRSTKKGGAKKRDKRKIKEKIAKEKNRKENKKNKKIKRQKNTWSELRKFWSMLCHEK